MNKLLINLRTHVYIYKNLLSILYTLYVIQRKYRLSQDTGMPISPNYGTEKSFTHIEIYLPGATRLAIECNMDETTTKLIMLR